MNKPLPAHCAPSAPCPAPAGLAGLQSALHRLFLSSKALPITLQAWLCISSVLFSASTVPAELPRHSPHQLLLKCFAWSQLKSSLDFSSAILRCIVVSPSRSKQATLYLVPKNIALVFIISCGLAVSLLTYRIPCTVFAFTSPGISSHYSISGERLLKSRQLCPPSPPAPIKGEPILSSQVLSPHKFPSIREMQIFPLHIISLPAL